MEAILLDLDTDIVLYTLAMESVEHREYTLMRQRSERVRQMTFNLDSISDHQCLTDYRFTKADIRRIANLVNWPEITTRNQYRCDRLLATCIFLHRSCCTGRWYGVELKFGLFTPQLSEVYWEYAELFLERFGHVLNFRGQLLQNRAELYAQAIRELGGPLEKCVCFIDCTKVRMSRPGGGHMLQRACYFGHKRMHCLTYQTITTSDGLIFALYGLEAGRRHNFTLLRDSNWEHELAQALNVGGEQYYIHGDNAYLMRPRLIIAFSHDLAHGPERVFNRRMSAMCIAVEHSYHQVKQYWIRNDFARTLKVRQCPMALMYKTSAILTNFIVCLYRSGITASRFGISPPSFEEYISFN